MGWPHRTQARATHLPGAAATSEQQETLSLRWGHPGRNPALCPLERGPFIPAAAVGQGDWGGIDMAALGSVFQPAAQAFQELQNGVRFLKFLVPF